MKTWSNFQRSGFPHPARFVKRDGMTDPCHAVAAPVWTGGSMKIGVYSDPAAFLEDTRIVGARHAVPAT